MKTIVTCAAAVLLGVGHAASANLLFDFESMVPGSVANTWTSGANASGTWNSTNSPYSTLNLSTSGHAASGSDSLLWTFNKQTGQDWGNGINFNFDTPQDWTGATALTLNLELGTYPSAFTGQPIFFTYYVDTGHGIESVSGAGAVGTFYIDGWDAQGGFHGKWMPLTDFTNNPSIDNTKVVGFSFYTYGGAYNTTGIHEFYIDNIAVDAPVTEVPETATLSLFVIGAGSLLMSRRKSA